jgi:predicted glutamine amidotransferase
MCRLLGIASSEDTDFQLLLREAPRCLARLSEEHRDGWGLAVHTGQHWSVEKSTEQAGADERFHALAMRQRGQMMVAHVRQKTVGPTALVNTHPFAARGWVFAHNGTLRDKADLEARCNTAERAALEGDTDSERLFRWLMTRFASAGLSTESTTVAIANELRAACTELRERGDAGSFNFLLADDHRIFAHRFGRSLYLLTRGPDDEVRQVRASADGMQLVTPWTHRRRAVLVASEALTDEPWEEVPDCSLLVIERERLPEVLWIERGRIVA